MLLAKLIRKTINVSSFFIGTMKSLSELKNIGSTIEKRLNKIGIYTEDELRKTGPVKAFQMICYYLYSLQGALLDLHWNDLPEQMKKQLKATALKKL